MPDVDALKVADGQEAQFLRGLLHQRPLVGADQHVLQHHIVGQQDVRRVGDDGVVLGLALLPREAQENIALNSTDVV